MPLIAGNTIIIQEQQQTQLTQQIVDQENDRVVPPSDFHKTVVIAGKEKVIAKHSQYLLDMITIEK